MNRPDKRPIAIIVDDEPNLCDLMQRLLAVSWPELVIAAKAHNAIEAQLMIDEFHPDVAFLDIRMPGMSGLELATRIGTACHIVFVTAYDQYAVQAFENAAVDYLLKPVSEERLSTTVYRLQARLSKTPLDLSPILAQLTEHIRPKKQFLQWLQVSQHNDIELVPVDEVDYFQASDKYTLVVNRKSERVIRTSLKELEDELDPERFWRIHRNAIVRVASIARVTRDFGGLTLQLHHHEKTLSVGRSYTHLFRQM